MKNSSLYYSVGPLLYCPADRADLTASLVSGQFGTGYSLSLCLEDTIRDDRVEKAEETLITTLKKLYTEKKNLDFYLPKIFIRVRRCAQILSLLERLGEAESVVSGFALPKFSEKNADDYLKQIETAGRIYRRPVYAMPILESPDLISLTDRHRFLASIRKKLDDAESLILNIRVGGNDLCHLFGFRRRGDETIYDILPVASVLSDIVTVFGTDYVVSGPVWEYYSGPLWRSGLIRELKKDRLCGFIGKTVIHPAQIGVVQDAYRVPQQELDDAKAILGWDDSCGRLVASDTSKERMNEFKTHHNWAAVTVMLAEAYGVKS